MLAIALQYAPIWHDKPASQALIEQLVQQAAPPPGSLVAIPEMGDTGWSMDTATVTEGDSCGWASRIAARHRIHFLIGFARQVDRRPGATNAAVIAHPDGSLGPVYEKVHPFGFTPEPAHFAPGQAIVLDRVGSFRTAPSICYDLRFPELHRAAVARGAELLVIVANWPRERAAHWRALVVARAIENQAFVVAVNRTGSDPNFSFGGGSLIISPTGEVLAEGGTETEAVSAELDHRFLLDWRSRFPALADRRSEVGVDFPVLETRSRTTPDEYPSTLD